MDTDREAVSSRLSSADPGVRAAAALELGAAGSADRLGLLMERLTTETHPEVLAAFLKAIGLLGSVRELALLAQYIDHDEPRVRSTVIEALFGLNTPVALPLIVPFLTDPDPRVRTTAALVLKKLGSDRALVVLQQMLASPHVWMRSAAATALGLFDAAVAVPLLEKVLNDQSPKVQERATVALARFSRRQLRSATRGISKEAAKAILKAASAPNLRKLTRKVAALGPPVPPRGTGLADAAALGMPSLQTPPTPTPSPHPRPPAPPPPSLPRPPAAPPPPPAPAPSLPRPPAAPLPPPPSPSLPRPPAPPPPPQVEQSLSVDGKPITQTEATSGASLIPISRRRWRSFLLVARILATVTDAAIIFLPLACSLFVLESLAGGMPPLLTPIAFLAGLALFLLRDLPSGPGAGKRLLGLQVVEAPGSGPAPRLLRQLPVILFPWGLVELYRANQDGRGQRPIDVKHGLEVVPRGSPLLAYFAGVWLVLFALVAGTYVFVTSRPLAPDGLLWSLKTGFRPRAAASDPEFAASAAPTGDASEAAPAPGTAPAPAAASGARWTHATMGLTIPVPRDWAVASAGSAFVELRPSAGSPVATGSIVVWMPDEVEGAPEVTAWGEEAARRFNQGLERDGLRLSFWMPPNGSTSLGGSTGRLYRGDVMGGQEAVVFACGRSVRPLAVTCRAPGAGAARRLAEAVVRDCRPIDAGPEWRKYRSPFLALDLKVPRGWAVSHEDRRGLELRPGAYASAAWIRLDPAPVAAKGAATDRIARVHRPLWEQHGFEVLRTAPFTMTGKVKAPGLVLDLRSRGIATARFRIAWIDGPAPCWASEWLERDALLEPPVLEELVASMRRAS